MAINLNCAYCSKEFRVTKDRELTAKYCCMACKTKDAKHSATCQHCNQVFEKYKSSNNTMKYCSDACYLSAVKAPVKEKKQDRQRYYKVCEVCATTFRVTLTRKDTAKTCSRECAGVIAKALYESKREAKSCLTCGNEMKVSTSRALRGNGVFCSKECMSNNKEWALRVSVNRSGENHYKWNGSKYTSSRGYVYKFYPLYGRTVEHRIVALTEMLENEPNHPFLVNDVNGNKVFRPGIQVHHIDRDRAHNSMSNLLVITEDAHTKLHNCGRKPEPWECWPSNPTNW